MKIDKNQTPGNPNNGAGRLNKLAYRDGYVYGTKLEEHPQEDINSDRNNIRKNDKTDKGFLLGITITIMTALLGGTFFLLMHPYQPSPSSIQTSPVPKISQP
jgi:hypothetical protein